MNIVQQLAKIADRVDAKGIHSAAEEIDQLIGTLQQETELTTDSVAELEAAIRAQLNPLGNLIRVANELDRRDLTTLADKMDKMIELEALKTQSAIDAILSIYKRKHTVASHKNAAWEDEGDPSGAADWWKPEEEKRKEVEDLEDEWKHPRTQDDPNSYGRIATLIATFDPERETRDLGLSTGPYQSLEDWVGYPLWAKAKQVNFDEGLNALLKFIHVTDYEDEVIGVDVDEEMGGGVEYTAADVTDSFLNYIRGDEEGEGGRYILYSNAPNQLRLSFISQKLIPPIRHERIKEQMPGEVPSTEDLERWFREGRGKGFCKRAGVRKDNTETKCPFGLPIPEGCKNVGSLIIEMDENEPEENKEIYESYKSGQPCPFAADILENQKAVNCNYGTPLAGVQMPELYHGSPIYPKMFEGFNTVNLDRSYQPTDFSNYSIYGGLKRFCKRGN